MFSKIERGSGTGVAKTMPSFRRSSATFGLGAVDVLSVDLDAALGPGAPDEVVQPVEGAEEGRLAASRRADDAQDLVPVDVEGDRFAGSGRPRKSG